MLLAPVMIQTRKSACTARKALRKIRWCFFLTSVLGGCSSSRGPQAEVRSERYSSTDASSAGARPEALVGSQHYADFGRSAHEGIRPHACRGRPPGRGGPRTSVRGGPGRHVGRAGRRAVRRRQTAHTGHGYLSRNRADVLPAVEEPVERNVLNILYRPGDTHGRLPPWPGPVHRGTDSAQRPYT